MKAANTGWLDAWVSSMLQEMQDSNSMEDLCHSENPRLVAQAAPVKVLLFDGPNPNPSSVCFKLRTLRSAPHEYSISECDAIIKNHDGEETIELFSSISLSPSGLGTQSIHLETKFFRNVSSIPQESADGPLEKTFRLLLEDKRKDGTVQRWWEPDWSLTFATEFSRRVRSEIFWAASKTDASGQKVRKPIPVRVLSVDPLVDAGDGNQGSSTPSTSKPLRYVWRSPPAIHVETQAELVKSAVVDTAVHEREGMVSGQKVFGQEEMVIDLEGPVSCTARVARRDYQSSKWSYGSKTGRDGKRATGMSGNR